MKLDDDLLGFLKIATIARLISWQPIEDELKQFSGIKELTGFETKIGSQFTVRVASCKGASLLFKTELVHAVIIEAGSPKNQNNITLTTNSNVIPGRNMYASQISSFYWFIEEESKCKKRPSLLTLLQIELGNMFH